MNYVQKINMRRMTAYVLSHLGPLVIAGLAAALIYAGYSYRGITSKFITQEEYDKRQQDYQEQLKHYEESLIPYQEQIQTLEDLIEERQTYEKNSVYLQIDGYHEWVSSCMLHVTANTDSNAPGLPESRTALFTKAVSELPETRELLSDMAAAVGAGSYEYVRSLVNISYDNDASVISVRTLAPDEDTARLLLRTVVTYIEKFSETLRDSADCTVSVLYETAFTQPDNNVINAKNTMTNDINALKNAVEAKKGDMNNISKPGAPTGELYSAPVVRAGIRKALLTGFAGGFLLTGIIYAMVYVFAMKLREPEELTLYYHIRTLGVIENFSSAGFSPKRSFLSSGRLRRLMEGKHLRRSFDEVMSFVSAAAEYYAPGVSSVSILTSLPENRESDLILSYLQEHFRSKNVTFDLVRYVSHPQAALKALSQAGGILLLEQLDKSNFNEVCKMSSELQTLDKPVIGAIYF